MLCVVVIKTYVQRAQTPADLEKQICWQLLIDFLTTDRPDFINSEHPDFSIMLYFLLHCISKLSVRSVSDYFDDGRLAK